MERAKSFKQIALVAGFLSVLLVAVFMMAACGDTPAVKVSQDKTIIDGITVTVEKETEKEFKTGVDPDRYVQKYSKYGKLRAINLKVSGTVSKADCLENAVGMDGNGNPVTGDAAAVYYTDFYTMSLKLPEGATKVLIEDGLPAKPIADLPNVKDGYYTEDIQWLLLNGDKSECGICGDQTANVGYFYFAFYDDSYTETNTDVEPVEELFVCISYDVTFND